MKTCSWRVECFLMPVPECVSCWAGRSWRSQGTCRCWVLCLDLWSLPFCHQKLDDDEEGVAAAYTLSFSAWMPCCCSKGCVLPALPLCPFPGYSTQDLPYSFPADTTYCICWDEIQACECKGQLPVSVTLKKKRHRRPKKSVASIDFLISWIAGSVIYFWV